MDMHFHCVNEKCTEYENYIYIKLLNDLYQIHLFKMVCGACKEEMIGKIIT